MANINITIDLDNSLYARGFSSENQIHQSDMDKAIGIIKKQLGNIRNAQTKNDIISLPHIYRTIGVFGDRGSGKTSFLISLLEKCKTEFDDVIVLRIIDPTLVEHKKPIVLCVISMITKLVEEKLHMLECAMTENTYSIKQEWKKVLTNISTGLFAIDNVGKGYGDSIWQDETYVLHTGLGKINMANDFEKNLREMFRTALNILDKKAFILSFDDIDVDVEQGWNVLEALRRYFSDERIISIVSGNIKLYGMLVRENLSRNLSIKDTNSKEIMANELESQYMLKLLNPSNRINLQSVYNLCKYGEYTITVKLNDKEECLEDAYKNILKRYKIEDSLSQGNFTEFLLSMSLRTQINFIKDAWTNGMSQTPIDVFSSRLYAAGIDVEALSLNAEMTNIAILRYLQAKGNLPECYLLLPTMSDKDKNSNFTALSLLECQHFTKSPSLIFDYMLRIAYIRNVILPLESTEISYGLCKYAGWYQMMSLKNNLGLTMAYAAGKELGSLKEHIPLFGMEGKAKKTAVNALDSILNGEENDFTKLMAMFPFVRITHNKNNESRSYYSIFALLAVIGEILKCSDEGQISARINNLKIFRSYQMPDESYNSGNESDIEEETFGVEVDNDEIIRLAGLMQQWKNSYNSEFLPPHAIGRIITRLYSSASNITPGSVGHMMHMMVTAFFNSCLIEEVRVKIPANEQGKINHNNPRKDSSVFTDNLGKQDIFDKLTFTHWIMACPLLNCFLDDDTYDKIMESINQDRKRDRNVHSVYELLCNIDSKGYTQITDKPSFSGEKSKGFGETLKILTDNGIDDEILNERIIKEQDIDKVVGFLKGIGLFGNVYRSSVEAFRNQYQHLLDILDPQPENNPT